jgi:predicted RNase H-like HicB family nuclease
MEQVTLADHEVPRYAIHLIPEELRDGESVWVATHPALPGCMAHGTTLEEAIAQLDDARRVYIQSLLEDGLPIPDTARGGVEANTPLPDWTLNPDQLIFMLRHHNTIAAAFASEDLIYLRDLAASTAFRATFGDMGFDEAWDRYETMLISEA